MPNGDERRRRLLDLATGGGARPESAPGPTSQPASAVVEPAPSSEQGLSRRQRLLQLAVPVTGPPPAQQTFAEQAPPTGPTPVEVAPVPQPQESFFGAPVPGNPLELSQQGTVPLQDAFTPAAQQQAPLPAQFPVSEEVAARNRQFNLADALQQIAASPTAGPGVVERFLASQDMPARLQNEQLTEQERRNVRLLGPAGQVLMEAPLRLTTGATNALGLTDVQQENIPNTARGQSFLEPLLISQTLADIAATEPAPSSLVQGAGRGLASTGGLALSLLAPGSLSRLGAGATSRALAPVTNRALGTHGVGGLVGRTSRAAPGFVAPLEAGSAVAGEQTPVEAVRNIALSPAQIPAEIGAAPVRAGVTLGREGVTPSSVQTAGEQVAPAALLALGIRRPQRAPRGPERAAAPVARQTPTPIPRAPVQQVKTPAPALEKATPTRVARFDAGERPLAPPPTTTAGGRAVANIGEPPSGGPPPATGAAPGGAPAPRLPRQGSALRRAADATKRAVTRALGETVTVVRQSGPAGTRFADKVERAKVAARIDAAEPMARLDAAMRRLTRAERGDLLNKIRDNDVAGMSRAQKTVRNLWVGAHTDFSKFYNFVGGRVLDPRTGPRPLGVGRENFVPQTLKGPILEQLLAGKRSRQDQAARHLVKTGQAVNIEDAHVLMREQFNPKFNGYFGAVERPRLVEWPREWLDTDPSRVMGTYLRRAWQRAWEISEFGQDRDGTTMRALLEGIRNQGFDPRAGNRAVKDATTLYEQAFDLQSQQGTLAYVEGNFTSLSKVGNLLNPLLQIAQTTATVEVFGVRRSLAAARDLASPTTGPGVRAAIRRSGALSTRYLQNVASLDTKGVLAKATETTLKAQGTILMDNVARMHAARTGLLYFHDAVDTIAEAPNSFRAARVRRTMRAAGFKDDAIDRWVRRRHIPERDIREIMIRSARMTQFEADALSRPVWGHSDLGRMALRLKNFALAQGRLFARHTLPETMKGNLRPLLYMLGGRILAGEAYRAAKDGFLGRNPQHPTVKTIVEDRDWQAALARFMHDMIAAGSFGILSDGVFFDKRGDIRRRELEEYVGPALSTADRLLESAWSVAFPAGEDQHKDLLQRTKEASADVIRKEFVGVGRVLEATERRAGTFRLPEEFPRTEAALELFNLRRDITERGGDRAKSVVAKARERARFEKFSEQTRQRADEGLQSAVRDLKRRRGRVAGGEVNLLLNVLEPAQRRVNEMLAAKRAAATEREKAAIDRAIEQFSKQTLDRVRREEKNR